MKRKEKGEKKGPGGTIESHDLQCDIVLMLSQPVVIEM